MDAKWPPPSANLGAFRPPCARHGAGWPFSSQVLRESEGKTATSRCHTGHFRTTRCSQGADMVGLAPGPCEEVDGKQPPSPVCLSVFRLIDRVGPARWLILSQIVHDTWSETCQRRASRGRLATSLPRASDGLVALAPSDHPRPPEGGESASRGYTPDRRDALVYSRSRRISPRERQEKPKTMAKCADTCTKGCADTARSRIPEGWGYREG